MTIFIASSMGRSLKSVLSSAGTSPPPPFDFDIMIVDLDFWAVTVVMNSFEFSESIADEIDIQSPVQQ